MGNYKCLHTISNAHDDWIKKVQCLSNNRILSYADDKKNKNMEKRLSILQWAK